MRYLPLIALAMACGNDDGGDSGSSSLCDVLDATPNAIVPTALVFDWTTDDEGTNPRVVLTRDGVTTEVAGESANTAGKTAGTTARAAAIGGLVDGSSGARTGAKVGLGASLLTRGNSADVASGSLLDFRLLQPFNG